MNFEESINMDSYQNDGGVREVDFQVCSFKHFFFIQENCSLHQQLKEL